MSPRRGKHSTPEEPELNSAATPPAGAAPGDIPAEPVPLAQPAAPEAAPDGEIPDPAAEDTVDQPPVTKRETNPAAVTEVTTLRSLRPAAARRGNFPVVGIGASAGGLDAFEQFFRNMPPDNGMAFVLVQHLDPAHKSILKELVQRHTRMEVLEISNGIEVRPEKVYVIPPGKNLTIRHGYLHLQDQSAQGARLPIDLFLRSLAEDQRERAVGVVLSGTGTEGALGLKAIKGEGGLAVAQDPDTAQHDGMPRAAIMTGIVDLILSPEQMPEALIRYVRRSGLFETSARQTTVPRSNVHLQRILQLLHQHTGHDFSLYKMNTIVRRIERRMSINQLDHLADYARYLIENPVEVETLFRELLIEVTSFFRDADAWELVRTLVIPELLKERKPEQPLRVWVPGCSTGEEAYTIAILLRDYMDQQKQEWPVQIFATDIDSEAIERARAGVYPESIQADLAAPALRRHFVHEDSHFRVKKTLRDMIVFAVQSVVRDPPFSRMDFVSCRNLLIYLDTELQRRLLRLFHFALVPGGYLHLGSAESVGESSELFTTVDRKWRIYRKKTDGTHYAPVTFGTPRGGRPEPLPGSEPAHEQILKRRLTLREVMEHSLLTHYGPPSVIVTERGDVLFIHGRTGRFLEPATGEATLNIANLAREGLRLEILTALRKAVAQKTEVRIRHTQVPFNGSTLHVNIWVRPVLEPPAMQGLFLISFEEEPAPLEESEAGTPLVNEATLERVRELERELQNTREYLQTTIEELETANEELRSSNEELQSSNEELQSTNEELETSKEELQSVNEELAAVNNELEKNVDHLAQANSDLNNLLASTEIGTVFLNSSLQIQRFTPAAHRFVNLIQHDVGRPLSHLVTNLQYPALVRDAWHVLETLAPQSVEVPTVDGRWCLVRIVPYRTTENVIDGVVITFTDVTAQRLSLDRVDMLMAVVEHSRSVVILTDLDGHIQYVNPAFTVLLGYSALEVQGRSTEFLRVGQASDDVYTQIRNTLNAEREWGGELCYRAQNGNIFWFSAMIRPMRSKEGVVTQHLAVLEDLSQSRQIEVLRRAAAIVHDLDVAVTVLNADGRILGWNRGAEALYGWSEAEALLMSVQDLMPEARRPDAQAITRLLSSGKATSTLVTQRLRKDGTVVDVRIIVKRLLDDNGQPVGISTVERPVET